MKAQIPAAAILLTIMCITGSSAVERVSVFGLKAIGTSQDLAFSLQEYLESILIRTGNYEVLSRADIDLILGENKLQQSGAACSDEACLVQTGAVLGVQKIITGTLSRVGTAYNLVLKLLNVESGRLESSASRRCSGGPEELLDISKSLLDELIQPFIQPPDTVVRTVVHTRTDTLLYTVRDTVTRADTVRVRDTLFTALPAAPYRKEVIDSRNRNAENALTATQERRRNRRIGTGALVILGSIAAGILTYQFAVR